MSNLTITIAEAIGQPLPPTGTWPAKPKPERGRLPKRSARAAGAAAMLSVYKAAVRDQWIEDEAIAEADPIV